MHLTEEEVQNLIKFANEIPTQYGLPLLQFINQKSEQLKVEETPKKESVAKKDERKK